MHCLIIDRSDTRIQVHHQLARSDRDLRVFSFVLSSTAGLFIVVLP
jgi:hypothetical protein